MRKLPLPSTILQIYVILKQIRNILSTPYDISVIIDQFDVVMDFSGEAVRVDHPYLIRLTDRSIVIFHVSNLSIRIEIK